jgi:hypothetical protein
VSSTGDARFDALADRLAERAAEKVIQRVGEMLEEWDREPEPLLNTNQAARFLGYTPKAVRAMARPGELPAIRLGNGSKPRCGSIGRHLLTT